MANIKSQKKRILTNAKRAERNKAVKSELRTRVKTAKSTIGSDTNVEDVSVAVKRIDMATAKGIIHKNTAARRKSRLMKQVNAGGLPYQSILLVGRSVRPSRHLHQVRLILVDLNRQQLITRRPVELPIR